MRQTRRCIVTLIDPFFSYRVRFNRLSRNGVVASSHLGHGPRADHIDPKQANRDRDGFSEPGNFFADRALTPVMGQSKPKRHPAISSGVGGRAGLNGAKADIAVGMSLAGGTAEVTWTWPIGRE